MPRLRWTSKDDQFMLDNYPTNTADWCANHLGRSKNSVHLRARSLGIKAVGRRGCRTIRKVLQRLNSNSVVCLCPKHGKTRHDIRKDGGIICNDCTAMHNKNRRGTRIWTDHTRELSRLSSKRQRSTELGRYANRVRVALRQSCSGRISFSKHLPYNAKQLCDHLEDIRHKQNNKCPVCLESYEDVQDSIDHIIPMSIAVNRDELLLLFALENLSLLCFRCNSAKGARV